MISHHRDEQMHFNTVTFAVIGGAAQVFKMTDRSVAP